MGSIDREVRMRQKAEAEAAVQKRLAELKAAGVDEKKMSKDVYLRQAKAEVRKSLSRIKAIDTREEIAAAAAQRKAEGKEKVRVKPAAAPAGGKTKDKDKEKDHAKPKEKKSK